MITVSFLSVLSSLLHTVLSSSCCLTKVVEGSDGLAGTYSLYNGAASFLPTCIDQCAYTRDGNTNAGELYCFRTEGATHSTSCTEYPSSTTGSTRKGRMWTSIFARSRGTLSPN